MTARATALAALHSWRSGRAFADAILQQQLNRSTLSAADRGFATELFYGVLRNLTLLDLWIAQLRSGSLDRESRDVLRLGLYQLFLLRTPSHAAVFETVELAHRRSRSLINAVLRNATRRADELQQVADAESLAVRRSHPQFLLERWRAAFGEEATERLCDWNNQPAQIYARVHSLTTTAEQFREKHPDAEPVEHAPEFLRLASVPAADLAAGACYIQDPSTALACRLLDPQPGETVLDACAAPGGKTSFLAAMMQNQGQLIACDREPARLRTLQENLERLHVSNAQTVQHDWRSTAPVPDLQPGTVDRILVDAPCTNTGVMRRRVDVRWRLQPTDFRRMQQEQLAIVGAVLPYLKPGGTLVYSTCSIEPEENEQVVEHLQQQFPFLALQEQESVLPFRDALDGAFAARLQRTGEQDQPFVRSVPRTGGSNFPRAVNA
ncbi:16S rRNA (cytosine(967)-C(5))-methyltransferase RsmB [soil metagenome]